jgi:outer membrane protein assembly factor BamB
MFRGTIAGLIVCLTAGCGRVTAEPASPSEVAEHQPPAASTAPLPAASSGARAAGPTAASTPTSSTATRETAAVAPAAETALASTRPGEDWPKFLGPRDNGVSAETGLLQEWPAEGPPLLWHRKLGEGYAPPSVRGERLIVQHRLRDREIVECLHAHTGETLWKYDYETDFTDPYGYNGGTRCAPVISATRVYTFGPQGKLLCLELDSGNKVWERDTRAEFDVPEHFFGAGCTPILDGNKLIVLVGGQPNSAVVAFDAQTGKTLWEAAGKDTWNGVPTDERGGRPFRWSKGEMLVSYSSPLIAAIHGKRHLLCLLRQGLASLDPDTGATNFRYWFRSRTHESVNAARPVVVDDYIFLSAAYETGAALLRVKPSGKEFEVVWRKPDGMATHWSTAIHHQGYVYGFSGRHEPEARLQCIALATGELQWETSGFERDLNDLEQDPLTGRIRDKTTGKFIPWPFYGRGSAILADGKLIVLGERGTLALVELNAERWVERARTSYPQIGYPSWAAPILSRGRLYLRAERNVVCLDLRAPEAAPRQ